MFKPCPIPFVSPEDFYYLLPEEDHRTFQLRTSPTDTIDSWSALHNYTRYSTPNTVIMYGTAIVLLRVMTPSSCSTLRKTLGTQRTRQDPSSGVQSYTYILDKENKPCHFQKSYFLLRDILLTLIKTTHTLVIQ